MKIVLPSSPPSSISSQLAHHSSPSRTRAEGNYWSRGDRRTGGSFDARSLRTHSTCLLGLKSSNSYLCDNSFGNPSSAMAAMLSLSPRYYHSSMTTLSLLAIAVIAALPSHQAFVVNPTTATTSPHYFSSYRRWSQSKQLYNYNDATSGGGGIEEIEFRIYPDGRVTEIVRGVKGKNCQSVTEAINKQLGNVVASSPTEEMFEEEVLVKTTLEQKDGGWDGASSW